MLLLRLIWRTASLASLHSTRGEHRTGSEDGEDGNAFSVEDECSYYLVLVFDGRQKADEQQAAVRQLTPSGITFRGFALAVDAR